MRLFGKDLTRELVVIAEIGVNHEGNADVACALVRLAAEAGADAVKFQTYTPERYIAANDTDRLARVTRFALDEAAHRRIAGEAARVGIQFFSTAVSEDVVPFLADLCPALKIASGDLTFEPVIRAAARTGKPVILSTGGGTLDEIDRAVAWVRTEVGEVALAERLALMQCVSAYPTPIEQANVRAVPVLKERYGLATGYSNHVVGPDACLAAVALGAQLIEVHVTDRKEDRAFRDHALSFEPSELAQLVAQLSRVRSSLGGFTKERQPAEMTSLAAMRKGVVAARDLAVGAQLQAADLMYARPASEFSAADLPLLIGARLKTALRRGELVRRAAVDFD